MVPFACTHWPEVSGGYFPTLSWCLLDWKTNGGLPARAFPPSEQPWAHQRCLACALQPSLIIKEPLKITHTDAHLWLHQWFKRRRDQKSWILVAVSSSVAFNFANSSFWMFYINVMTGAGIFFWGGAFSLLWHMFQSINEGETRWISAGQPSVSADTLQVSPNCRQSVFPNRFKGLLFLFVSLWR